MKRSTERILTTHTGSLPRPDDLADMLFARESGDLSDRGALEARVRSAVAEVVRKQAEAGVNVVNDGEMGKIGYSTYVKDRLTGFEMAAEPTRRPPIDLVEFPDLDVARRPSSHALRYAFSAVCTGDIKPKDLQAVQNDIATLKAAGTAAGAERLFMSAASPGVVAFFIPDQHYGNYDAYLAAIAEAMRPEYRAIVEAGISLQLDCPDLAMAGSRFSSVEEFRRFAARNVEALNHALDGLPPEHLRVHICWGNYEGPHTHDVELKDIVDIVLSAHAAGVSLEECNPRL